MGAVDDKSGQPAVPQQGPPAKEKKPLGTKSYGHIVHLPGSRLGPGDHRISEGQARIACEKARDRFDVVSVTEKLDGSCCAVMCLDGQITALVRSGYPAWSSKYKQHQYFAVWVQRNAHRFEFLKDMPGIRVVGEWLAQAHGTRYDLRHEPFVPFDILDNRKNRRVPYERFTELVRNYTGLEIPHLIWMGGPIPVADVLAKATEYGFHGALDPIEGAVWRVERNGEFDFITKYVRPGKEDGKYLPEISGGEEIWNWKP